MVGLSWADTIHSLKRIRMEVRISLCRTSKPNDLCCGNYYVYWWGALGSSYANNNPNQ